MSNILTPYRYVSDATQNLFIGGVGGVITDATILETYFETGSYLGTITNFTIDGSLNIACTVDSDIRLILSAFQNDSTLTYFNDTDGWVKNTLSSAFRSTANFTSFDLLGLTIVDTRDFQQSNCTDYILTGATEVGNFAFLGITTVNVIDIRNCTTLSSSVSSTNNVFFNIKLGCTIYANIIMETINGGDVHADLAYARDVRSATLIFIS